MVSCLSPPDPGLVELLQHVFDHGLIFGTVHVVLRRYLGQVVLRPAVGGSFPVLLSTGVLLRIIMRPFEARVKNFDGEVLNGRSRVLVLVQELEDVHSLVGSAIIFCVTLLATLLRTPLIVVRDVVV